MEHNPVTHINDIRATTGMETLGKKTGEAEPQEAALKESPQASCTVKGSSPPEGTVELKASSCHSHRSDPDPRHNTAATWHKLGAKRERG